MSDSDDDSDDGFAVPPFSYLDALRSGPADASTSGPRSPLPSPAVFVVNPSQIRPSASTTPHARVEVVRGQSSPTRRRPSPSSARRQPSPPPRRRRPSPPPHRRRRPRAQLVCGLPLRQEHRRPAPSRRTDRTDPVYHYNSGVRRDVRSSPPPPLRRRVPPSPTPPQRHHHGSPPPPHRRGSPPSPAAKRRVPAQLRLSPRPSGRRRISPPNAEGWQEVLGKAASSPRCRPAAPSSGPRPLPPELADKCLNCLSTAHRRVDCKMPTRCLRCRGLHHLARHCKRPRRMAAGGAAPSAVNPSRRPVRARRENNTEAGVTAGGVQAQPPVPLRHAPVVIAATAAQAPTAAAGAGERRQPRRFHRSAPRPGSPGTPRDARGRTPSPGGVAPNGGPLPASMDIDSDPLPQGHPTRRPRGNPCYLDRDADINTEEARLRLALVAQVGNGATNYSPEEARAAIIAAAGVDAEALRVVSFYPESFLITCGTQATRDVILNVNIPIGNAMLAILPWTRVAHAELKVLRCKVVLELEGIPPHAWSLKTVSTLLAPYCWVEQAEAAAVSKSAMDKFKVTAWTDNPDAIATDVPLFITEDEMPIAYEDPMMQRIFGRLPPYLREKVFRYTVIIHLKSVADFSSRSPSPSPTPPSSDGDSSHDGNPDRGYGETRGVGPRLQGYTCRRGIIDGTNGGAPPAGAPEPTYGQRRQRNQGGQPQDRPQQKQKQKWKRKAKVEEIVTSGVDGGVTAAFPPLQEDGVQLAPEGHAAPHDKQPQWTVEDQAIVCSQERRVDNFPATTQDPMLIESAPRRALDAPADPLMSAINPSAADKTTPAPASPGGTSVPGRAAKALVAPTLPNGSIRVEPEQDEEGGPAITAVQAPRLDDIGTTAQNSNEDNSLVFPWLSPPVAQQAAARGAQSPAQGLDDDDAAARKLDQFAAAVQTKVRTPLVPLAPKRMPRAAQEAVVTEAEFKLPQRSRRLATQALANVPASRRGEVLMMKRFGVIKEDVVVTKESRAAYDELYRKKLAPKEFAAARVLFPSERASQRPRRAVTGVA
ncbi:unnamed protein product [Urochloa decumbens]|uniref:CCHC-type domain-containing protein n=1 Tax=Urochloa decumbens TaxID=240449 RepID=A0ABC8V969_9POAL